VIGGNDEILQSSSSTSKKSTTTTTKRSSRKDPTPRAPPSSYNPQDILKPPINPTIGLEDDVDSEPENSDAEKEGIWDPKDHIRLTLRKNRDGIQHDEEDSDEENERTLEWDSIFLHTAQKLEKEFLERQSKNSTYSDTTKVQGDIYGDDDCVEKYDDEDDEEELDLKLEEYMAAMDLELSKTNIGKDFNRPGKKSNQSNENSASKLWAPESVEALFEKLERKGLFQDGSKNVGDDVQDSDEEFNMDINLVQNLMESFSAQQGLPGPTSNLLGRMGLLLPRNDDNNTR
jgi:hypothetical protein